MIRTVWLAAFDENTMLISCAGILSQFFFACMLVLSLLRLLWVKHKLLDPKLAQIYPHPLNAKHTEEDQQSAPTWSLGAFVLPKLGIT